MSPLVVLNTNGMTDKQAAMAEAIEQALYQQADEAMRLHPDGG